MGRWSREELQAAHDDFVTAANEAGRTGDWSIWTAHFTDGATYKEHLYGEFNGRDEITAWITATMSKYPNNRMTSFPHEEDIYNPSHFEPMITAWCRADDTSTS